jgi:hypothetical protein
MAKLTISDLLIYRWRYALGYIAIGIACIALLVVASLYIPGGLSEREIRAVTTSNALSIKDFDPSMVINLPYYLTQKASFYLFGLSEFSIKLPTILIGFLSIVGLVLLLRTWFKQNVAILTAVIGIATGPFLLAAQSGTPGILYIFWPIWLFYTASMISRRPSLPFFWKALFFIIAALSLYTPLSIYILLTLVSAVLLHPHLRHLVRKLSKLRVATTLAIASVFVIPLVYSLILQPQLFLQLLGVPDSFDIIANVKQLFDQYINVFNLSNGTIMTPVYEVASLLLVAVGIFRVTTAKYTARSYIISAWLVLLVPVLLISPQLINVTFVPFLLLMGYGVEFLIRYWYQLFPRNPYARIVGLIPIVIFITTLTLSGIDRFVYGYLYNPSSTRHASGDLTILKSELAHKDKQVVTLVVSQDEQSFYSAVRRYNPSWNIQNVSTSPTISTTPSFTIATRSANSVMKGNPAKILTSATTNESDRFYLYKNTAQ